MPVQVKRTHSRPDPTDQNHAPTRPKRQRTRNAHDGSPEPSFPSLRHTKDTTRGKPSPATKASSGPRTPTNKQRKSQPLFSAPTELTTVTPSRGCNADRSAKKKSVRLLLEQDRDDVAWDGTDKLLAEEIMNDDDNDAEGGDIRSGDGTEAMESEAREQETPEKRRTRLPKGARSKRSPTPEGELPPHERYFFQNRAVPAQTSNNTLSKVPLLTHEEYFQKLAQYVDPCRKEKEYLLALHRRSFPQWYFELHEHFNICLYGYGSKRKLLHQFADWLYHNSSSSPKFVIVNGYAPNLSLRSIFATIFTASCGDDHPVSKLGTQPSEALELLQSALKSRSSSHYDPVIVLINSIDAPLLRPSATQVLLARLAGTPSIHIVAAADTPNFSLMWDVSLRDQFKFVFHDCTTFVPYSAEFDVIEEFHRLVGRRSGRVGGKEGVGFVLKSLPENARNLYRLLLTEVISLDGGHVSDDQPVSVAAAASTANDGMGIEFRSLYQKASEEFIASSEMMFRTLLKEFHDHQMITSRVDSSGTEILSVPLSREEMEWVLEDLVLA